MRQEFIGTIPPVPLHGRPSYRAIRGAVFPDDPRVSWKLVMARVLTEQILRAVWILASVMGALLAAVSEAPAETNRQGGQDAGPKQTLRQRSLDPTSDLTQIQLDNRFVPSSFDADGYANLQTTRIVFPIPKSQAFPIRQLWRATFPILTAPGGPTGLSDIRLLGLFISGEQSLGKGTWWRFGLGPVFVSPTATEDVLGRGKWQLGPTVGGILYTREWQFAVLIQNPISFAGDSDRSDVNRLIWQPILVYWLAKGWYLGLQGTAKTVNWENDARATIPVSGRIGKVTKIGRRAINLFVEPEYTVVHDEDRHRNGRFESASISSFPCSRASLV